MCLCFFSDEPHPDDTRADRGNMFKTGMKDAPCNNPGMCCVACLCPFCVNCYLRHKALDGNLDNYTCCQGYYDCMCFKAGSCGDQGNPCCLCLEGCCCDSCAVSSTRMYVMDKYDIASDPCDRRIIRFNNFMQLLACVCDILAMFDESFRDCAQLIRFIADIVYAITAACMNAQVDLELKEREGQAPVDYATAPKVEPPMDRQPQQPNPPVVTATAQQQRTFPVTIPEGVYAGTQLQVQAPTGQLMMFSVPPGATPGQQVLVPY
ncbi:hypothetical protein CTAYLR_009576 [Chrysophaeum taylorii]|uniref:Uncharacterized protein n=1 Tax=Chrysophaeum taylorii TaxID=2483200 RepID=A0AAD7UPA7_9STRA|nr:hypothetical protein CTAYLR_009576 [Chrysophaeum taylorii]